MDIQGSGVRSIEVPMDNSERFERGFDASSSNIESLDRIDRFDCRISFVDDTCWGCCFGGTTESDSVVAVDTTDRFDFGADFLLGSIDGSEVLHPRSSCWN